MKTTQVTIKEPKSYRRARRQRARADKLSAIKNLWIMISVLIDDFPELAYKEATSLLSKTIVIFLLVGTMLMTMCFALTAMMWFCEFIPF